VQVGLGIPALAQTGQDLGRPLSVAIALIFLGGLLLLAPGRRGVWAIAVPQASGAEHLPAAPDHPRRHAPARINAPTVAEADRRGVSTAPGVDRPPLATKQSSESVRRVGAGGPGSGDLMEALERQLQAADARMARLRAMHNRR